jgi:hypothetical protein
MATLLHSKNKLKGDSPSGFVPRRYICLALQYAVNDGDYLFSYKKVSGYEQDALRQAMVAESWSDYRPWAEIKPDIDIELKEDSLVQVDTVGPDLSWSLTRDAVMTEDDHSALYGELRYFDGDRWSKREAFEGPTCSRIRFKAKLNPGGSQQTRHKFSYNVLLRDRNGVLVEHEIDPDIKNPSV